MLLMPFGNTVQIQFDVIMLAFGMQTKVICSPVQIWYQSRKYGAIPSIQELVIFMTEHLLIWKVVRLQNDELFQVR